MLDDAAGGFAVSILGGGDTLEVVATGVVALGHKIALREIRQGESVIKFGVPIFRASKVILVGDWVHLHNIASTFDERSATLDVHTGAVTDTRYE